MAAKAPAPSAARSLFARGRSAAARHRDGLADVKAKCAKRTATSGERLRDALARTAFATMGVLSTIAAGHGLSLTHLRVGGILRDRRLRMTVLAQYLGLAGSTMTHLVERAEKRALMARAPSPDDGRAVEVFLTGEGLELAHLLDQQLQDALAPSTDRLTVAEQRTLRTLLERLLEAPDHRMGTWAGFRCR
jgi:DNA-binding MarR family transcriptional regulator